MSLFSKIRGAISVSAVLVVLFVGLGMQGGCTRTAPVPASPTTPVATSTTSVDFDRTAYETLMVSQAALNAAKLQIAKFPQLKETLNQAIVAYNTAIVAYKVYHATVNHDHAATAQLGAQLAALTHSVSALSVSLGARL